MKIFPLLFVASLFLSACASSPVAKHESVHGTRTGNSAISLRAQPDPAKLLVRFNMHGYTIIGVAIVGAAIHKMNVQTDEFTKRVADYNQQHPDIPALQDAYNTELLAAFKAHGVEVSAAEVTRIAENDDGTGKLSYTLPGNAPTTQPTVVIDRLGATYLAASSTDPYKPGSGALVTVIRKDQTRQEALVESQTGANDPAHTFDGFDAMTKDMAVTYAGLLTSVRQLARNTVDELLAGTAK